ncbi:MAG: hypothetical protein LRY76_03115 [Alphaproteobacteria bacterium]|nr:hypothetical protein [Alphaproteobacteria bacterium]
MTATAQKTEEGHEHTDYSLWWNPDSSTWDEDIYRWCQETGFNPFGSGPTPIFVSERINKKSRAGF